MSGGRSLGGCGGTPGIPVALSQAIGPPGPQGIQGSPGPKGDTGTTGLPGNNGADGIDGLSAYQLAVAGGFVGSVNEWLLSLIGPQGQQGIAGPAGSQGAQGVAGPTGPTGPVGANGAQGPQGVQGTTGTTGATGAAGPQGIKGDQGIQGFTGAAGNGIASVVRTSGTGAPGTTDTYTITFTNATTATFTVYNGANGTGSIASVTASGPLASTGGSNPNISLVQDSSNRLVTDAEKTTWNAKQPAGSYSVVGHVHLTSDVTGLESQLNSKQATLVSGANIKTVGGASIVGSGNVDNFDINGGTIDGVVIGGSSAAAGSFTTLSASSYTAASGYYINASTVLTPGATTQGTQFVSSSILQWACGSGGYSWNNNANSASLMAMTNAGAVTIPGTLAIPDKECTAITFYAGQVVNWTATTNNSVAYVVPLEDQTLNPSLQPVYKMTAKVGSAEKNSTSTLNVFLDAPHPRPAGAAAAQAMVAGSFAVDTYKVNGYTSGDTVPASWGLNIQSRVGPGAGNDPTGVTPPSDSCGIEVDMINELVDSPLDFNAPGHSYGFWAQANTATGRLNGTAFCATHAGSAGSGWINGIFLQGDFVNAGVFLDNQYTPADSTVFTAFGAVQKRGNTPDFVNLLALYSSDGATNTEKVRINSTLHGSGSNSTGIYLYVAGAFKEVTLGAANSGGSGLRALCVAN